MSYLVTGGAGFIGSYVVRQLLDEGESVVALDRSFPGALDLVLGDASRPELTRVVGEVTDLAHLLRVCEQHGIERIIHLAGELHARSAENPWSCIQSNVIGTHNVLEVARMQPIRRVVTASSAAIFGHPRNQPPGPIANDARLYAADVYEASKIFGESEGEFYFRKFGVDNAALRIGLAYGFGCRIGWAARFVEELVEKPLRGEPGRVPWASSRMNWIYSIDAADAFVRLSRATTTDTFAYNIAGDSRTIDETVQAAREAIPGADVAAEPGEHNWSQVFDDAPLRRDTGYTGGWTLEQGLADIVRLIQSR